MSTIRQSCPSCKADFEVTTIRKDGQVACTSCGRVFHGDVISPSLLWYYARGTQKVGPMTFVELKRLAAEGQLKPADLVLQASTTKWIEAGTITGLFPMPVGASVPVPTPSLAPKPAPTFPIAVTIPQATTAPVAMSIPSASSAPANLAGSINKKHDAQDNKKGVAQAVGDAGRLPTIRRSTKVMIGAGGLFTLIGCLACCVFVGFSFLGSQTITASASEKDIGNAVGLVICGDRWTNIVTGESSEEHDSAGSCFAISAQGHLLTNRHVVQIIWELQNDPKDKAFKEGMRKDHNLDCPVVIWVFFGKERHEATQGQLPLKRCSRKDFEQEVFVPATDAAFHDDAVFAGMLL